MRLDRQCFAIAIAGLLVACSSDDTGSGADGVEVDGSSQDSAPLSDSVVTLDSGAAADPDTAPSVDTSPAADTYIPPQPGEFGYDCDENDDCNSGWCVQTSHGRRCTKTCLDECPPYFDCREAPGTDATFICIERFIHLCDPCTLTQDCNEEGQSGNFCLSYAADGKFCGAACDSDADCPGGGYVCRNVPVGGGGQAKQCVPSGGAQCQCSELAKALQLSTTCFVENDNGKCEGSRFCTQAGLNLCDAPEPFPESCNNLDDNCNGQTDEFPPNYQCFIENEFGSCPGQGVCTDGKETCEGTAPAPESCNLIDDDCDGVTDNNLCDDQNPCTIDFCDSDGDCAHENDNTLLCDDGNICTQVDKCLDGMCVGYNPLPCGDGNPCFSYQCDPVVGCLSQYANGASCEDGEPCTIGDTCNQGVCVSGDWDVCDDGNECSADSCNQGQGCVHNPLSNIPCGGAGSGQCQVGTCANGQCLGIPTNEGGLCNLDGLGPCQEARCQSGQCAAQLKAPGTPCSIGTHPTCSGGTCSGSACVTTPHPCDDDDGCTDNDTCRSGGVCVGEERDCNAQLQGEGYICIGIAPCVEIFSVPTCLPVGVCF